VDNEDLNGYLVGRDLVDYGLLFDEHDALHGNVWFPRGFGKFGKTRHYEQWIYCSAETKTTPNKTGLASYGIQPVQVFFSYWLS
jgi:hypothetical protein